MAQLLMSSHHADIRSSINTFIRCQLVARALVMARRTWRQYWHRVFVRKQALKTTINGACMTAAGLADLWLILQHAASVAAAALALAPCCRQESRCGAGDVVLPPAIVELDGAETATQMNKTNTSRLLCINPREHQRNRKEAAIERVIPRKRQQFSNDDRLYREPFLCISVGHERFSTYMANARCSLNEEEREPQKSMLTTLSKMMKIKFRINFLLDWWFTQASWQKIE